jgi:hypothetical protein
MEFNYKANYLKAGLIVNQTQTIAELLNNGQSFSEIKLELEFKNILNTKSPVTAKTYFSIIQSRLELLNSDFWNLIRYSDKELSVQTIFVASIKLSPGYNAYEFTPDIMRKLLKFNIKYVTGGTDIVNVAFN